ncbi:major facilitator superfamily domain-containing protein [Aspergillus pseudoustus]|uniref:Major facilitator superfamily domain-containing protein n=1 Tax=Aspergillus pseudoustus TaxID=1810923 RepID=A0ABR4IWQ7_9EURO
MSRKDFIGEAECVEDATKDNLSSNEPLGSFQLIDPAGEIRLVPVPSRDPNDPLRLPEWRKWMCLVTVCLYGGFGLSAIQAIAGILPVMSTYYMGLDDVTQSGGLTNSDAQHSTVPSVPGRPSYQTISQLGTLPSLFVGVGGILSVLLAEWIGSRLVMVLDSAMVVASLAWCAASNGAQRGLYSHIAARCVLGLAVGSVESLVPLMLRDIHYVHQRNSRIGAMWAVGGTCGAVIGIVSTYIVAALSWRWFYWILTIASGVCFIMVLLFIPETTWPRAPGDHVGRTTVGSDGYATPLRPTNRPYSYRYAIRMIPEHPGSLKNVIQAALDMLRCMYIPNVIWVVLLNAVFIGTSLSAGIEFGTVLVAPPYSWKQSNVGLIGIPLAISGFVVVLSGIVADRLVRLMAQRNGGMHEPEHQLVNMILPAVTGITGSLLLGITFNDPYNYHWAIPMLAYGLLQFGFVAANVTATTYTIECFPGISSALVIVVGALRNIVGFGITYGVVSFVEASGFLGCFGTYAGLLGGISLAGIPLYIYGKQLRGRMERWKVGNVSV